MITITPSAEAEVKRLLQNENDDIGLDRKSTIYLSGIRLDHQSGLSGRGFVFENPLAANTCGCGESFSL